MAKKNEDVLASVQYGFEVCNFCCTPDVTGEGRCVVCGANVGHRGRYRAQYAAPFKAEPDLVDGLSRPDMARVVEFIKRYGPDRTDDGDLRNDVQEALFSCQG